MKPKTILSLEAVQAAYDSDDYTVVNVRGCEKSIVVTNPTSAVYQAFLTEAKPGADIWTANMNLINRCCPTHTWEELSALVERRPHLATTLIVEIEKLLKSGIEVQKKA